MAPPGQAELAQNEGGVPVSAGLLSQPRYRLSACSVPSRGLPRFVRSSTGSRVKSCLPGWTPAPLRTCRPLDGPPAVLQHNDLGTWNIMVTPGGFTAVNWESARRHGLPLWDLWYLLVDALAQIDRVSSLEGREKLFMRLFRGELPRSRGGVERAVGRIATLCSAHHGLSLVNRLDDLRSVVPGELPRYWLEFSKRIALAWLREPGLGPSWDAFPR